MASRNPHSDVARGAPPVHDRDDVHAGLPDLAPGEVDNEGRALSVDRALLAETKDGLADEVVALVAQRHLLLAHVPRDPPYLLGTLVALEDVAEVGGELEDQLDSLRTLGQVLDDHVLVHAARHEPLPRDGYRGIGGVLLPHACDHATGVVVDDLARERSGRLAVDEQPPGREMPHIGVEEPVGVLGLHAAARVRDEERAPVEHSEVPSAPVAAHAVLFARFARWATLTCEPRVPALE